MNFIPTGVQLAFTPYITDRDRVRLTVNAEISDRDLNTVPTLIDGAAVLSLVTRNFQTTVELRDGQTLAVAGLMENKLDLDSSRIPFFGSIPFLGRIGAYDRTGNTEKELVILVTPRLVHPMEHNEVPPLPGHDLFEPTDCEFYLLGRLESHYGVDYRSPIRTDCSRVKQARELEQRYLFGPSGPSIDLPAEPAGTKAPTAVPAQTGPTINQATPAPPGNQPISLPAPPTPNGTAAPAASEPDNAPAPEPRE